MRPTQQQQLRAAQESCRVSCAWAWFGLMVWWARWSAYMAPAEHTCSPWSPSSARSRPWRAHAESDGEMLRSSHTDSRQRSSFSLCRLGALAREGTAAVCKSTAISPICWVLLPGVSSATAPTALDLDGQRARNRGRACSLCDRRATRSLPPLEHTHKHTHAHVHGNGAARPV